MQHRMRKVIISGMLGNGLEWYDYALYAHMTLIISRLFFPAGNESVHLLATFGIFAMGFVARPFGGVFFGYIGDKFGRRIALALSIFMMAIPTGCIGLLPTYQHIGIWAPILLTLIRLLQGLSLGGAYSGAMAYTVEHAPIHQRALAGSSSVASLVFGFLLGSVAAALVKAGMSLEAFETWGWRIPFLAGVVIGFTGFYIRHYCEESPEYEAAKQGGTLSKQPLRDVITHHMKPVILAIGIYMSVTMPFYLLSAYMNTFTEHNLGRSKEEALLLNSLNMAILFFVAPFSAWLTDRVGRKKVLMVTAACYLLFTYPLFTLLTADSLATILIAQALFAIIVGFYIGPIPALLVEAFPTAVRYTGMALSYNLCAGIFGGTAPMVSEWLIQKTGTHMSVALYVMACAAISLIALVFYHDRWREPLR